MKETISAQVTAQFYNWELRGRGLFAFKHAVDLEPVFEPFSYRPVVQQTVDDGKQHTVFSLIAESLKSVFVERPALVLSEEPESTLLTAYRFIAEESLHVLQVAFPPTFTATTNEMEEFVTMLSSCRYPISFEIIANHNTIKFQLVCRTSDTAYITGQLNAYFPMCVVTKGTDEDLVFSAKGIGIVSDFGLKEEFVRSLAIPDKHGGDPLTGLFGILDHLEEHDRVCLQILFKGTVNPWTESIIRAVTDSEGHSFFLDAPEMPKLASEKVASPLFAVVLRVFAQSGTEERANRLLTQVGDFLIRRSKSAVNTLLRLDHTGYPEDLHVEDMLLRESHRIGILLNSKELSTFVRFPTEAVSSTKLNRNIKHTRSAPAITEGQQFILGQNIHHGAAKPVSVNSSQRLRHTHIIGATGTGKSTMILNLMEQDIRLGQGITVLDPHGDLIEGILAHIPESRIADVILVDPSDASYPIGFNILSAHSEIEKEVLSSDLVSVFRRLSTSWGDQMNSVFANAILAFLEHPDGGTLLDLRRFLIEKAFRDAYLQKVQDPNIIYYWQREFPLLKTSSIGPILTRLDTFLRPKVIRNMVAQKRGIDFEDVLDSKKILLVKLAQGLIGNENSYVLGSFFVSKIYQAAMARQAIHTTERRDHFLYIDEFQNFITPSMSAILSGARKYHLGMTLVHQDMQQLVKQDSELASAVISNSGTRVCFRVGDVDAKRFAEGFAHFEAADLQNLNIGETIVRVDRPEHDFTMNVIPVSMPHGEGSAIVERVVTHTRQTYATPRKEVEAALDSLKLTLKESDTVVTSHPINKATHPIGQTETQAGVEPLTDEKIQQTKENLIRQKELTQHRYLQTHIKKMAEARGFKAVIEQPLSDGQGLVDVSLERNGKRIACEIGVTTSKEWELHNIEKCLSVGYEYVVAIATEVKAIERMQRQIDEKLPVELRKRVWTTDTESLFVYLDKLVAQDTVVEKRAKGYRVSVNYKSLSQSEIQKKREGLSQIILDALRDRESQGVD